MYVTNWDNYNYTNGYSVGVTLEEERGNNPIFSQNSGGDWVSSVLTVKGTGGLGFSFYSNKVKVYDNNTKQEITNGFLKGDQKIFIVSKEDPTNISLSIATAIPME